MNSHSPCPKHAHISVRILALSLISIISLISGVLPANAHSLLDPPQQACRTVGDFPVCGRFLEEWSKQGSDQASVYVNGLPITAVRPEISLVDGKTYDTQWFERAKYEAHPENKAPYDVQLGLLGASLAESRGIVDPYTHQVRNPSDVAFVGIDKPSDADGVIKVWFTETRHSVSGKILEYWNRYGGLSQFGFPLSEPFQEISDTDNKIYTVQYFERNRFELHPENADPYAVELGLLGVQQYKMTPVPGDQLFREPPPGTKSTKDTLVVGTTTNNPSLYFYYSGDDGGGLMYEGLEVLAWYTPTVENGGARFVGTGDNRYLQVKYKMRPGMKWSDGVEITSDDVLYGYKYDMDPTTPIYRNLQEELYNVDNPDKYTVIANFMSLAQEKVLYAKDPDHYSYLKDWIDKKLPTTDAGYDFALDLVLPAHVLSKYKTNPLPPDSYWRDPNLLVTDGPFKLESFDVGHQVTYVPNPYYTATAPPPPQ